MTVTISFLAESRLVAGLVISTSAVPRTGVTNLALAVAGAAAWPVVPDAAGVAWPAAAAFARNRTALAHARMRCVFMCNNLQGDAERRVRANYRPLHLPIPVLRLRIRGPEDLQVPLAAAPGLDHLGGDDVDEDLGERAAFRVAFQVVGGFVPAEVRIQHHRQEQVVAVIDHDDLA